MRWEWILRPLHRLIGGVTASGHLRTGSVHGRLFSICKFVLI